ncbi:MAG: hypothetical protein A3F72_04445 [Bacteroidetes bacterium RIFCSPLOWO2_12_FULL_35_15]|nr:MAG: hypothetical protein A3F72_04445 [Bacteroidetes bacterium RIFCSPLOWO2_12_FULL_35_15]
MKKLIYFVLLFLPLLSIAQTSDGIKIITLHPSIGKSIDAQEKKEFFLFPDYKDSIFESAEILKYNDSTYAIRFTTITGKVFEKPVNTNELDAMFAKVDSKKPNEYVETNRERTSEAKERKSEGTTSRDKAEMGLHVGNIILQVVLITLSILVRASY